MTNSEHEAAHQTELRAATEDDVPFLLELRRQTMTAHQLASGVVPSEEERLRRVLVRFECAKVVFLDNHAVGLLKVARDGHDWELIQIQLAPTCQRKGIGERLILSVIADAKAASAALRLSVLRDNPARRLYERLGFVVDSEDPHSFTMRLAP
jgi:ribosomal protein S18 acetylase RimI-like enzyme